ncbi:MAG: tRNA (adenosine(37)-N6)-threonylcarbamoyltransferase complex transferase subunit TsaD, partial [Patescibacteria group bacterium]
HSKNFDFSFSGLKTAVLYLVRDLTKTHPLSKIKNAIAAEAQQAIIDVLIAKTMRAAEKYKARSIMLSGGVSANKLLRKKLEKATKEKSLKFFRPEIDYTTDNATMIALAGYYNFLKDRRTKLPWQKLKVNANLTF